MTLAITAIVVLVLGIVAGVITKFHQALKTTAVFKSLKSAGYDHFDASNFKVSHGSNVVTWDFGNTIARLYYFPYGKHKGQWRLYDITTQGERLLVNAKSLGEWLDSKALGQTAETRQLVSSALDN